MKNAIILSLIISITLMVTNALATPSPIKIDELVFNENFCGQAGCEKSFKNLLELAKNGSPRAKLITGLMYKDGIGTDKNEQKSRRYLMASARAGLTISQYIVGVLHIQGSLFEYNLDKGNFWLNKAAKEGYEPALKLTNKNKTSGDEESTRKLNENKPAHEFGEVIVVTREPVTLDDYSDYIKKNTLYGERNSTGSRIRGIHICKETSASCRTIGTKTEMDVDLLRRMYWTPGTPWSQ